MRVGSRWEKPGEVEVCTPGKVNYSQNRTQCARMKKTVVRPAVFEDGVCNKKTGVRAGGVRVEDARWE